MDFEVISPENRMGGGRQEGQKAPHQASFLQIFTDFKAVLSCPGGTHTSCILGLLCTSLLASLSVSAEDAALFQNQSLI